MTGHRVEVIIRRAGQAERRHVLEEGTFHVGRAEDNGLVLPDISVSRRHARVTVNSHSVVVEDVGSGNGTYFRGRPIKRQEISNNDEIVIDPFTIQFLIAEAQEPERTDKTQEDRGPVAYDEVGVSRSVQARLETIAGHGLLPEYLIAPTGLSVGRGDQRDIVLPDPASSRRHAEVSVVGSQYLIRDTGSVNGTFVNGQRIREHILVHGDRIRIGSTEFRFSAMEAEEHSDVGVAHEGTRPFDNLMFTDPGGQVAPVAPPLATPPPPVQLSLIHI